MSTHQKPRICMVLFLLTFILAINASVSANPLPVVFKAQVPPGEWANTNNCGQTSALMVMSYHQGSVPTEEGIKDIDEWLFQKYGDPINSYNGSVTNTTKLEALVKEFGGYFNSYKDSGWDLPDLRQQIDVGLPVIVAVTAGYLSNRGYSYAGGHFVVVIGYTQTHIICNDPGSSSGAAKYYLNNEFSQAFSSQSGSILMVIPNLTIRSAMQFRSYRTENPINYGMGDLLILSVHVDPDLVRLRVTARQ